METKNYFETDYNENGTITKTLFADGNEYRLTYKPVETISPGADHIYIDEKLHEVISKIRVNHVTVTPASGPMQRAMQQQRLKQGA